MTNISVSQGGQHASAQREAKPHRWALNLWARTFRRFARRWTVHSHVRRFCQPFTVEGRENLDAVDNPVLIIANHTSHFDTVIVLDMLPHRIYDRTAVVAAADRMYRDRIKGAWHSLRYNAFPITRGGGREALAYSQWLLHNGWSLLIFPEGKRSRTGELLPFHGGPAILATLQNVPVLPIYIQGASDILPPGTNRSQPAPVNVRVGDLLTFPEGTSIGEAKHAMEQAVRALAGTSAVSHDQAAAS
ncbi:MAG TPA: lysophospholipid acyltransferase family protein [Dehalococcoidia bacterium]|jgi:1-acyl-sn-glycerol-3-phosphate acyltransferase|nr:lysophospholipid acyltransferase family protein [Dehalococcoidia bacterium]